MEYIPASLDISRKRITFGGKWSRGSAVLQLSQRREKGPLFDGFRAVLSGRRLNDDEPRFEVLQSDSGGGRTAEGERKLPDMMSASESLHGKAYIIREVA